MVSFRVSPLLRVLKRTSLIAFVCAARAGAAQPLPDPDAALERIVDDIFEARAEGGTYAKELIEPLTDLSAIYRERGNYVLETVTLQDALQVVRANYGLRSLEQAPLMRQRIRSEETIGNFSEAWELEASLLSLVERHPDDLRTVPILHEIGDKRMELLRSHLAGERPPQLILGCYYEPPEQFFNERNCQAGSRGYAARRILFDAQSHYANAIGVLRRRQEHAGEHLEALETKLLHSSFLMRDYGTGRRSLVRRIFDDAANSEPLLRRIDRLVELADWDLRAGQRTLAFDLYAEIYTYLEERGADTRSSELFAPATPALLPAFLPNLLSPERADGATGYVDVEFDVTRFGTTRRIKVLDTTQKASRTAENRISRWLVDNRFRPRIVRGEPVDTRYVARHYVHE